MNARDAALFALDGEARLPGWRGGVIRARRMGGIDPRDRALADQLYVGVVKNLLLLQRLIEHHSGRRLNKIDEGVQKILAIALYQLRFLDRIPHSAAVNEAVDQTKRSGRTTASGFVNAVLRNALRQDDPPMDDGTRWSHPSDVVVLAQPLFSRDDLVAFFRHNNSEPPLIVRLLPGATLDQLRADESIRITPHEQPGMFVVEGAKSANLADWSKRNLAQPQDPTSADIINHLDLQKGQRVLDRCAGFGTKTLQIAERIAAGGEVVAIDPAKKRLDGLRHAAASRGFDNVHAFPVEWMRDLPSEVTSKPLDRILIDAPCGNSGVLARRPEARYTQDARSLASLHQLQLAILLDTAPYLAPDGLLVYSTCSIWPSENEAVIADFLGRETSFELVEQKVTLPSLDDDPTRYRDGGFFAVIRRRR